MMKQIKLPKYMKKYFWDCNFDKLEFKKYTIFVSERILCYGDWKSVRWLRRHIGDNFIKNLIKKSRNLDNKTRNFWEIYLSYE